MNKDKRFTAEEIMQVETIVEDKIMEISKRER